MVEGPEGEPTYACPLCHQEGAKTGLESHQKVKQKILIKADMNKNDKKIKPVTTSFDRAQMFSVHDRLAKHMASR